MWILPTLSRPAQCAEVLRRIRDSGNTSRGIVVVNGQSHAAEYRHHLILPEGWEIIWLWENAGALGALNEAFNRYPNEPWYGFIADDEFIDEDAPRDWGTRLIAAAGDWRIAHGWEDWNLGKRCQGYPVLGGKLVRAVGHLALPTCFHSFGFDSMYEWLNGPPSFGGGGLHNIVCLPEIKIHHNRAKPDLEIDDCYKIVDDTLEKDRKAFWDFIKNDLQPTAERVKKAMAACTP